MAKTRAATSRKQTVPTTMKAAALGRFGPPSVLKLHVVPVPEVGPNDILIAVYAAGVGVWDASVRDGSWRPYGRPRFPLVPGTDGAGIVIARGARVRRFNLGDRVYADQFEKTSGFYAEYVAVDQKNASLAPKDLDMLDAGAVPVTGLTALQGIDDHLQVRADESVLIFGATGAVGTLAIQFARRKKARVIATASGNDARRLVKRLGADGSFDPRAKDPVEQLKRLAPDGIDAALALAGGEVLEQCLDSVRAGGRVAYPNGVEPEPRKRRSFSVLAYDAISGPREFTRVSKAISEADLEVPIAAVFPLADAARAHEQLEKGHVLGRIALRVRRGNG